MKKIKKWSSLNILDQTGKNIIITGANSGLGYETTLALVKKNARVIMACRNLEKAENAYKKIIEEIPDALLEIIKLDLASLDSIKNFVKTYKSKYNQLHVLINNAGTALIPNRQETVDGFEMHFGVNHLGHFVLTGLILDPLLSTNKSRIITLTTLGHRVAKIDFNDLQSIKNYSPFHAYVQSELANVLFAFELQRKLKNIGKNTISIAIHPGFVDTGMLQDFKRSSFLFAKILSKIIRPILAQSTEKGAQTSLFAATSPNIKADKFYGPSFYLLGKPCIQKAGKTAYDKKSATLLWKKSEELTGIKYKI